MTILHPPCSSSPSEHISSLMCAHKKELSILPQVAVETLNLIKELDADVHNVSRLLERDLQLTTDILRLANSPIFGGYRDVSRLSDAVVRLGLDRCKNLILAACTANLLKRVSLEQHWIRDLLWQHSYTTGICCQILNSSLGLRFSGEEFTAGLIHDIGRLLLAAIAPDQFSEGDPMDFNESDESLQQEWTVFETDHVELGSWFAEQNGLPYELVDVIRYHHHPELTPGNAKLVGLVCIADQMSNHFLRHESQDDFDLLGRLPLIPQLQEEGTAPDEASCDAILTLAWNKIQNSTDLPL